MTIYRTEETKWEEMLRITRGSSYQDEVSASYGLLVRRLGDPSLDGDGYKVDTEWVIKTPFGIATLYNYKNGPSYTGEGSVENISQWHIGAKNRKAADWLLEVIQA